jgi:hypothetical protein
MTMRISRIAAARMLLSAAGLALGAFVLTALAGGPARAATASVVSYWDGTKTDGSLYDCGTTWDWQQGAAQVNEVYNPCSGRVWVHYVDEGNPGGSGSFCVNPDGGLAYDIPLKWARGDLSDIQLTSNTSPCDSTVSVTWVDGATLQSLSKTYDCQPGDSYTVGGYAVDSIANDCDSRIWLHTSSGGSYCLNPTNGSYYERGIGSSPYSEVQTTSIEAPCSATLPYPSY